MHGLDFHKLFLLLGVPVALRNPDKMHGLDLYKLLWLLGVPAALETLAKLPYPIQAPILATRGPYTYTKVPKLPPPPPRV